MAKFSHCSPEELAAINKALGDNLEDCYTTSGGRKIVRYRAGAALDSDLAISEHIKERFPGSHVSQARVAKRRAMYFGFFPSPDDKRMPPAVIIPEAPKREQQEPESQESNVVAMQAMTLFQRQLLDLVTEMRNELRIMRAKSEKADSAGLFKASGVYKG